MPGLKGDALKYITSIARSTDRMNELIKDLLLYARLHQVKELKKVDCQVLLNDVLFELDTDILLSRAIITSDPLPVIKAHRDELKLLFRNLIENAIKFRKIWLIPEIHISANKTGKTWLFEVNDNGIGIDPLQHKKIFNLFQCLNSRDEYAGTGLGLAQCKKIAEMHQGVIWVDSEPGKFSKFYFTINTDFA